MKQNPSDALTPARDPAVPRPLLSIASRHAVRNLVGDHGLSCAWRWWEARMDDLNFLKREALKCRDAARRSGDRVARDGMERLARAYEREAALQRRRSIAV